LVPPVAKGTEPSPFLANFLAFIFAGNNITAQTRFQCFIKAHFGVFQSCLASANRRFQSTKLHSTKALKVRSSFNFADLFSDKAKSAEIPACISSIFNAI